MYSFEGVCFKDILEGITENVRILFESMIDVR